MKSAETVDKRDAYLIAEGKYISLLQSNGKEFVERNKGTGAVEIIACLPGEKPEDTKILIVEQYRAAVDQVVLELPAGVCGDQNEGEAAEIAAARELAEETGYKAGSMHFMSMGPSCAGLCSELTSFFLATNLTRVGDGGGVDNERITVHEAPLIHIGSWIARKKLMADPRIWAGLYLRIAFLVSRPDVGRI